MVKDIGRKRYRPTAEMRTFLGIVDGGGRGPDSDRPPNQTQMDHVVPYRQGLARGRTALDDLVLLAARDHRIKTSGLWEIVLQPGRDPTAACVRRRAVAALDPTRRGRHRTAGPRGTCRYQRRVASRSLRSIHTACSTVASTVQTAAPVSLSRSSGSRAISWARGSARRIRRRRSS